MKSNNTFLLAVIVVLIGVIIGGIFAVRNKPNVQTQEEIMESVVRKPSGSVEPQTVNPEPRPVARPAATAEVPSRNEAASSLDDLIEIISVTRLTPADISSLQTSELRILRNAVYARHGYRFKSADLRDFFGRYRWYTPSKNVVSDSELSQTEQANIMLIKSYE